MTNEQAYVVLENCASLLDSGTRFFTEDHVKQFHEAYELAMEALRKTECKPKKGRWIPFDIPWYKCSECGAVRENKAFMEHYCPNCGADMRGDEANDE